MPFNCGTAGKVFYIARYGFFNNGAYCYVGSGYEFMSNQGIDESRFYSKSYYAYQAGERDGQAKALYAEGVKRYRSKEEQKAYTDGYLSGSKRK